MTRSVVAGLEQDTVIKVIFPESKYNGVCILTIDGFYLLPVDQFGSLIVTELDAVMNSAVVHNVGFKENDGALVKPVGEQVACPEAGNTFNAYGPVSVREVFIGWELGGQAQRVGNIHAERLFLIMAALEYFHQHLKAFVIMSDLVASQRSV